MRAVRILLPVLVTGLFAGGANAAVITSLLGDKDCFGIAAQGGSACATGLHYENDLGGVFFEDNREVDDPLVTDIWHLGSKSFTIDIAFSGTATSAVLDLFHAGAGTVTPGTITINGSPFGNFGAGNNLSAFTSYDITSVVSGSNSVSITLSAGDGWSLDYAELTVATPEPAILALMGFGFVALGLSRRRRDC